jgi:hypothetical protein
MSDQLQKAIEQLVALQKEQILKLEKIATVLVSTQLLTECVDHQGDARTGEDCATITLDGFSAALCLMSDLDQRNRDYKFQEQEFFVDDDEDADDNDEDDEGDNEKNTVLSSF